MGQFINSCLDKASRIFGNPDLRHSPRWSGRRFLQLLYWARLYRLPKDPCLPYFDTDLQLQMLGSESLTRRIWFGGYYQYDEEYFIKRFVRPGMTVIDAGANVGVHTVLCAKRVRPGGRVHSFEPVARTFEILCRNIRSNGLDPTVSLKRKAITDESDLVIRMEYCVNHAVLSRIHSDAAETERPSWETLSEDVPTVTIDDYVLSHDIARVDFIKADIEGAEGMLVLGARKVLDRDHPVVLCEFNRPTLARLGWSTEQLWDAWRKHGYEFFSYNHRRRLLYRQPEVPHEELTTLIGSCSRSRLAQMIGATIV